MTGSDFSPTGLLPSPADLSIPLRLTTALSHSLQSGRPETDLPTTPTTNPYPVTHAHGSASSAFARHYSRNHTCFLFLRVLRCFTSPRSLRTLCIQIRVTRHHSCRVSPFGHPRIIARLTAPRGLSQPPTSFIGSYAKASTMCPKTLTTQKTTRTKPADTSQQILLRCSQPLSNKQTPHPTTKMEQQHPPNLNRPGNNTGCCLRTQQCAWRSAAR